MNTGSGTAVDVASPVDMEKFAWFLRDKARGHNRLATDCKILIESLGVCASVGAARRKVMDQRESGRIDDAEYRSRMDRVERVADAYYGPPSGHCVVRTPADDWISLRNGHMRRRHGVDGG